MAEDRDFRERGREHPLHEVVTPSDASTLPRVLDPVVTMGLVQRYIEAERARHRRAVAWMGAGFLFFVLLVLAIGIALGIFILAHSRRAEQHANDAVSAVDEVRAQAVRYSMEVVTLTNQVDEIGRGQERVRNAVEGQAAERARQTGELHSDLRRFSAWVASRTAPDREALAALEARLALMEKTLAQREKELADLRKQQGGRPAGGALFADTPVTTAGGSDAVTSGAPATASAAGADFAEGSVSVEELFRVDMASLDASVGVPLRPRGEVSGVTFPNGDRYEGEFQNGLFSGVGTYFYRNGDRYEGEFRNDMKEGKGTFVFANGDRYVGSFAGDRKAGRGALTFRNGDRYVGEFANDRINGKGTILYQDGNRYVGDFVNGMRQGTGVFVFSNGDVYKGEFQNDVRQGRGVYLFRNGAKYRGEFRDGLKHGRGHYVYPSGEQYEGEFRSGAEDGIGVFTYPNGTQVKGVWKKGQFLNKIGE